jgi:hypothetical protein
VSAKKPFLTGMGIGLIIAACIVETTHWLNSTSGIVIPTPSTNPTASNTVDWSGGATPAIESSTVPSANTSELEQAKEQIAKLKKKLAAKPTMRIYINEGTNSWNVSAMLKEAGVIQKQNDFLAVYNQYANQFQLKKGFYSLKENMKSEDVLRVLGAPIPTPSAAPTVAPTTENSAAPSASPTSKIQ